MAAELDIVAACPSPRNGVLVRSTPRKAAWRGNDSSTAEGPLRCGRRRQSARRGLRPVRLRRAGGLHVLSSCIGSSACPGEYFFQAIDIDRDGIISIQDDPLVLDQLGAPFSAVSGLACADPRLRTVLIGGPETRLRSLPGQGTCRCVSRIRSTASVSVCNRMVATSPAVPAAPRPAISRSRLDEPLRSVTLTAISK